MTDETQQKPWEIDYSNQAPTSEAKPWEVDWSRTSAPKQEKEQGDFSRGLGNTFKQLPQLGYGLLAGSGSAMESIFGEGGFSSGVKKAGVKGYKEWGDKLTQSSKASDEFTYSYEKAKEGDFGALIDWLQYGLGYAAGQGVQALVTGGVGKIVGQAAIKGTVGQVAEKMVAKEVAEIAASSAGKELSEEAIKKLAISNVAGSIGQTAAIGAQAFGMEGGEIFGDLASRSVDENRALTSEELARAAVSTLFAGGLEFVGDKVGLDLLLGKSSLLKPAAAMEGIKGRLARGAIAATGAAPIEGGTEYAQTLIEEAGKGNDPFSAESLRQAKNAAALGVVGGVSMGGIGGLINSPTRSVAKETEPAQEESVQADPLFIENKSDPYIAFPDGSVGKQSEVDQYIKSLPEDQQNAARAALLGYKPETIIQETPVFNPQLLENKPDPYIVFPDGSVGKRDEVDAYINSLPEADRIPARAALLGYGAQKEETYETPESVISSVTSAATVDDAISQLNKIVSSSGNNWQKNFTFDANDLISKVGDSDVVVQNRNRNTASSVVQINSIAANPDYNRLSISRDFGNGAPFVFSPMNPPARIAWGKEDFAVAADGRKIPFRYAVVSANDVVSSNNADGTPRPEYKTGVDGAFTSVNNGRMTGLQEAFRRNTASGYSEGLTADDAHGVDPKEISSIPNAVLTRVMARDQVTPDIGDLSNTRTNADLSPIEQAANDSRRINIAALSFDDNGVSQDSIRQFVNSIPATEANGLRNPDGSPTRQANDRVMAAVFHSTYENPDLVALYAQATDPEAKNILNAMAMAAPTVIKTKDTGDFDIRGLIADAAQVAVNAKRNGAKLSDFIKNQDFTLNPETLPFVEFIAENIRSPKKISEGFDALAQAMVAAHNASSQDSMFETIDNITRGDVLNKFRGDYVKQNEGSVENTGGTIAGQVSSQQTTANTGSETGIVGSQAKPVSATTEQEGFSLESETPDQARSRLAAKEKSAAAVEAANQQFDATQKQAGIAKEIAARQDASAENFQLGQSAEDSLAGQGDIFQDQPSQSPKIEIVEGKGLVKGKFLAKVDGESIPGNALNTREEANQAALEWIEKKNEAARNSKLAREKKDSYVAHLKSGGNLDLKQIESLNLRGDYSDMRWFIGAAADLFQIPSRQVRPYVQNLVQHVYTDMGAKNDVVPTNKALKAIAEKLKDSDQNDDLLDGNGSPLKSASFEQSAPFKNKSDANIFRVKNGINGTPKQTELGWRFEPNLKSSDREKLATRDAVNRLNKAFGKGGEKVAPVFDAPSVEHALAKELGRAFGIDVHFVSANDSFDGVAHNGKVFLSSEMDVQSSSPELAIAGHEMLHVLEQENPELGAKMRNAISQYLKDGVIDARRLRESRLSKTDVSESTAAGEVMADINGAMWLDAKFWRELRDADRNLFRQAAYMLMETLTKAIKVFSGSRFDASTFVTDVDAVRKILVQVWTERNQMGDINSAPSDSDLAFSFAGAGSETADVASLVRAKEMLDAGRSTEFIRQDTGWYRGEDGFWRYEISDDGAALINPPIVESFENYFAEREKQRYGDVLPSEMSPKEYAEYQQFKNSIEDNYNHANRSRWLDDLLHHPKLFAAYPDLQKVRVRPVRDSAYNGSYYPNSDMIELTIRSYEEMRSTLMHEIQHAIQHREGFATGGNVDHEFTENVKSALSKLKDRARAEVDRWTTLNTHKIDAAKKASDLARYGLMYDSAKKLMTYANRDKPSGVLRLIRNEIQWIYTPDFYKNEDANALQRAFYNLPKPHKMRERNQFLSDLAYRAAQMLFEHIPSDIKVAFDNDPRTLRGMINALERESSKKQRDLMPMHKLTKEAAKVQGLYETHKFSTPYSIYRSLSGEVEARNVQARLNMTEEQRASKSPLSTRDVRPENAIILFGGLEISAPMYSLEKRKARDAAESARAEYDKLDALVDQGGATDDQLDQYLDASSRMTESKLALAKELANTEDDMFAFSANTSWGQVFLNRSAKGNGGYQVTYMNKAGEPVSDTFHKGKEAALNQFVQDADPASVREFDPESHLNFSRKDKIEVDGVDRPTTNSNGKPLATTEEGIRNFWRWFGDSNVVNASGNPLVVYHGTPKEFSEFSLSGGGTRGMTQGTGFYFTNSKDRADIYTYDAQSESTGNVMPVYLKAENPFDWGQENPFMDALVSGDGLPDSIKNAVRKEAGISFFRDSGAYPDAETARVFSDAVKNVLIRKGYDSIIAKKGTSKTFIVFNPNQIKSATGNNGEFSSDNSDIRFSRKESFENLKDVWKSIGESEDTFKYPKSKAKDWNDLLVDFGLGDYRIEEEAFGSKNDPRWIISAPKDDWRNTVPVIISANPREKSVWINTAFMREGDNVGARFYQMVADWAKNNDYTFVGDPDGLSDTALRRRTEQMLASALKHGTTDHLMPHDRQVNLSVAEQRKTGVRPLDWSPFETDHNIKEMLQTVHENLLNVMPDASKLSYNEESGKYYLGDKELDNASFFELSRSAEARRANAGITTLKRAAITNSILSGEMGAYRGPDIRDNSDVREGGVDNAARDPRNRGLGEISYSRKDKAERDLKYLDLVKSGNLEEAQKLVDQAALEAGYITKNDYRMAHQAPNSDGDVSLANIRESGLVPDDYWTHPHWYQSTPEERQAFSSVMSAMRRLDARKAEGKSGNSVGLPVYRAVPKDVKDGSIRNGDWVSPSREYAQLEGQSIPGGYKIISQHVLIKNLYWDGNSIAELGVDDGNSYAYKNTKNNRKLVDVVTRDDNGDVIPLSKRFNSRSDDVRYSRKETIVGDNKRERTPEQLRAFKNVGRTVEVPTLKERWDKLTNNLGKKLAQGIVDQFAPVKELSENAYMLMRLSKGASGAFEAMLKGGQLKLSGGVYDFDDQKRGGVIDRLLVPLQGEADDFMWWVAGNRAERLAMKGKERLFSPEDISAFKSLADGDVAFDYTIQHGNKAGQKTRNRKEIYKDSLITFNEFNKNTLDMAEQSGLIDGESRKYWEDEFYVPFYRVSEESEDGIRGMNIKSGVVRQQAFKKLKGGADKLNSDLLENTMMNWAHLLDAAAKNRAAKATLEAAQVAGIAEETDSSTKKTVWFMDGNKKRYFLVEDAPVLAAIQGLEFAGMRGPLMDAMSAMKHAMTMGVTASPFFKVRNLIRDSVSAIGLSELSYNPLKNIKEGYVKTDPKSDDYFRLLAGGGTIHFGSMLEGSESKRVRKLVESGVDESTILRDEGAVKAFYRKSVAPMIDAYNELGNRGESINRAALYDQLRKQGKSHAEASLMARDLMDFSMQGAWSSVRFLTQVVPFMNARLQGLYKLGRSAKEDPRRFANVLGGVAMASVTLMLIYGDDDDWKKREDWDRDNFWWFKVGGVAYRIPKPFEIGAIGTLAERGVEYFASDEMTGQRFKERFISLISENLSMNPIPQMVKPILDVYSNKDAFTGRPIETLSMERLQSDYRFNGTTSIAARAMSTAGNTITNNHFLSPVQVDHMIRGYFGWLGSFVVGASDKIVRPMMNEPTAATPDYWKVATGGLVADTKSAPSRYVTQMYDQAKVLEEAYGTWQMLMKTGKVEEAREFAQDNMDQLRKYKSVESIKRAESKLNEKIRVIERSNLSSDEKRERIQEIKDKKDAIARMAS